MKTTWEVLTPKLSAQMKMLWESSIAQFDSWDSFTDRLAEEAQNFLQYSDGIPYREQSPVKVLPARLYSKEAEGFFVSKASSLCTRQEEEEL